jgi:hypothetical protein
MHLEVGSFRNGALTPCSCGLHAFKDAAYPEKAWVCKTRLSAHTAAPAIEYFEYRQSRQKCRRQDAFIGSAASIPVTLASEQGRTSPVLPNSFHPLASD